MGEMFAHRIPCSSFVLPKSTDLQRLRAYNLKLTFYIDTDNGVTIRKLEGDADMDTFMAHIEVMWGHPDYQMGFGHIIDLRDLNFSASSEDMWRLVDYIIPNKEGENRKLAILVGKPMEAALGVIYVERVKDKHMSEVFASERDALRYINGPDDLFDKLNSELATQKEF